MSREDSKAPLPEWPEWIEAHRVDDDLVGAAYEAAGPVCRAAVKTAIALFTNTARTSVEILHEDRTDTHAGFWMSGTSFPAPWAVVAFHASYTASARLLGAVMPAILTGVPIIAACAIGGMPSPSLLATLDLAGIQDIFSLEVQDCAALLDETQPGPGRLVLLHSGQLDTLRMEASSLHIPLFEERRAPEITITRPDLFNLDVLRFAHGNLPVDQALDSPAPTAPDVMYASPEAVRRHCQAGVGAQFSLGMAPLALGPGCECFWPHARLRNAFFLSRRTGFGLCSD